MESSYKCQGRCRSSQENWKVVNSSLKVSCFSYTMQTSTWEQKQTLCIQCVSVQHAFCMIISPKPPFSDAAMPTELTLQSMWGSHGGLLMIGKLLFPHPGAILHCPMDFLGSVPVILQAQVQRDARKRKGERKWGKDPVQVAATGNHPSVPCSTTLPICLEIQPLHALPTHCLPPTMGNTGCPLQQCAMVITTICS